MHSCPFDNRHYHEHLLYANIAICLYILHLLVNTFDIFNVSLITWHTMTLLENLLNFSKKNVFIPAIHWFGGHTTLESHGKPVHNGADPHNCASANVLVTRPSRTRHEDGENTWENSGMMCKYGSKLGISYCNSFAGNSSLGSWE